ncbi:MAG: guanylate kinase [Clostridiales bacterium]|nr:guanylate kinase [Clostridiales bacterium]
MGKIFYLMGKSSSGKDSIYKRIIERNSFNLKPIIGYTTRPIREGEREGVEYYFVDNKKLNEMQLKGIVIERRDYNTVFGIWSYFTADDGQINIMENSYLLIGTLEAYEKIRGYFGEGNVVPIFINVDDGIRLKRALEREMLQETPKYAEMCRRFLVDEKDFSTENKQRCGIMKEFENDDLEKCIEDIEQAIKEELEK